MTRYDCNKYLGFLSQKQREDLTEIFAERRLLQPHVMQTWLKITPTEARRIIAVLSESELVVGKMLIYHTEHPDTPFGGYVRLSAGYPPLPWHCAVCDEDVEDYDDMDFEFAADITQPVEFV